MIFVLFMICCFAPILAMLEVGVNQQSESQVDNYCGARCVQYVLKWSNPDANYSLMELIDEIQDDSNGVGVSMLDLQKALAARGISGIASSAGGAHSLNSDFPAIVHTTADDGKSGHFVVWHPTSDRSRSVVWDGITGIRAEPPWVFHARIRGAVLFLQRSGDGGNLGSLRHSWETFTFIMFSGISLVAAILLWRKLR